MRSRFSAFALGLTDYLFASWHPSTRPAELELDPAVVWRRLQLVDTVGGAPDDAEGVVEFRASYRDAGGRRSPARALPLRTRRRPLGLRRRRAALSEERRPPVRVCSAERGAPAAGSRVLSWLRSAGRQADASRNQRHPARRRG
jgi:hypothetical protein